MNKLVSAAILALPLLACVSARAAEPVGSGFYAGVATGLSKSTLENSAGERFSNTNRPLPVKLYAGFELTNYLALEAGYAGLTGKHLYDKRLTGTTTEPRLSSKAIYVAAKGTVAVSDSIDLHAKLGVARSYFELSDAGASNLDLEGTKPMFGIGAAYKLTERAALTLEFEHYGTLREQQGKLSQRRFQAGLKFGF